MAVFRSLWIGDALSPFERLCIQSFLSHGHGYELFVYDPVANVPASCRVMDARAILPEDLVFRHGEGPGKGSYAGFSDLFRYKLLLDRGGWWVDTDVVCLAREVPEPPIALAHEDAALVNGAILRFPSDHPAMQFAYDTACAAGREFRWGDIGPRLVTQVVRRFGLERWLVPTQSYYPINYREVTTMLRPGKREEVCAKTAGATFLHLWNEMFRRTAYDKGCCPPTGSYLRGLFDSYGMSGEFNTEYRIMDEGDKLRLAVQRFNHQA